MKAVFLLFDSMNRRFLPNYGCGWTKMPNFQRLGRKAVTFDNCYGGSMPCIPARREMHTGRYNFLHRSWGPMEPFDESVISDLRAAGVYTHISTDHFHYWQDGGSGYLTKFDSHQIVRGQQGDRWMGQVEMPYWPETLSGRASGPRSDSWRHDWINRAFLDSEEKMPQARTFAAGLDFIERCCRSDRWFLQIEAFDPHEPFFTQESYRKLYEDGYEGKNLDWPDYGYNGYGEEATRHVRMEYAALLSMCDRYLGKLLDVFDEKELWKDTLLIVGTDHGFLLGERGLMGKNLMPWYDELVHTPLFIYDPRRPQTAGQRRSALVQTVDFAPTLAGFFGIPAPKFADGRDMAPVIQNDVPVREAALFGAAGGHINVTDGRYVYMRAPEGPDNGPLYEYTLMPAHMEAPFSVKELGRVQLAEFGFTKGAKVMKIPARSIFNAYWTGDRLYDLEKDPDQTVLVCDDETELRMLRLMRELMLANEAPAEQYRRVGIPERGPLTKENALRRGAGEADLTGGARLRMTPKGRRLLNAALSMLPPAGREKLLGGAQALCGSAGKPLDEEAVIAMMCRALPPSFAKSAEAMLRVYILD